MRQQLFVILCCLAASSQLAGLKSNGLVGSPKIRKGLKGSIESQSEPSDGESAAEELAERKRFVRMLQRHRGRHSTLQTSIQRSSYYTNILGSHGCAHREVMKSWARKCRADDQIAALGCMAAKLGRHMNYVRWGADGKRLVCRHFAWCFKTASSYMGIEVAIEASLDHVWNEVGITMADGARHILVIDAFNDVFYRDDRQGHLILQ